MKLYFNNKDLSEEVCVAMRWSSTNRPKKQNYLEIKVLLTPEEAKEFIEIGKDENENIENSECSVWIVPSNNDLTWVLGFFLEEYYPIDKKFSWRIGRVSKVKKLKNEGIELSCEAEKWVKPP